MPSLEQIKPPSKEKPKFVSATTEYGEREKGPKWEAGAETSASEEHPTENQDAYFFDARRKIGGLFDGVGGRSGGKIASHEAGDIIHRHLSQIRPGLSSQYVEREISEALAAGHKVILAAAEHLPDLKGMATTASVGKIITEGGARKLVYGHIGDSRIYVFHRNGELEQITQDDSLVNHQIKRDEERGNLESARKLERIAQQIDEITEMPQGNPDLKFFFERRNAITAGLGVQENFSVKTGTKNLDNGDIVLFTSDGIHDNLTKSEIKEIADKYYKDGPQRISEALVEAANEKAAKKPNGEFRAKYDDKTAMALAEELPDMTEEAIIEE